MFTHKFCLPPVLCQSCAPLKCESVGALRVSDQQPCHRLHVLCLYMHHTANRHAKLHAARDLGIYILQCMQSSKLFPTTCLSCMPLAKKGCKGISNATLFPVPCQYCVYLSIKALRGPQHKPLVPFTQMFVSCSLSQTSLPLPPSPYRSRAHSLYDCHPRLHTHSTSGPLPAASPTPAQRPSHGTLSHPDPASAALPSILADLKG